MLGFSRTKVDDSILAGSDTTKEVTSIVNQAVSIARDRNQSMKKQLNTAIDNADIVNQSLGISNVDNEIANNVSNYPRSKSVNTEMERTVSAIDNSVKTLKDAKAKENKMGMLQGNIAARDSVESTNRLVKAAGTQDKVLLADAGLEFSKDEASAGVLRSFTSGFLGQGYSAAMGAMEQNQAETGNKFHKAEYVPGKGDKPGRYEAKNVFTGNVENADLSSYFAQSNLAALTPGSGAVSTNVTYQGQSTIGKSNMGRL